MTGADIRWPGVDRDRARGAAWHLERAVQHLRTLRRAEYVIGTELPAGRTPGGRRVLVQGLEHSRIARGFLGAIGFEQGGRL